jgi:hypothetical protein
MAPAVINKSNDTSYTNRDLLLEIRRQPRDIVSSPFPTGSREQRRESLLVLLDHYSALADELILIEDDDDKEKNEEEKEEEQ